MGKRQQKVLSKDEPLKRCIKRKASWSTSCFVPIHTVEEESFHLFCVNYSALVGSVEKQSQQMWVYDSNENQMNFRACSFVSVTSRIISLTNRMYKVPGLYKIFDEIIVNAADNKQRDPSMNRIEVDINPDDNTIRVWNNGNGVPIAIHQEHNIYVPELIFGHLLTGKALHYIHQCD
jgi:hypothetical protein